jgi:hypothetical protein
MLHWCLLLLLLLLYSLVACVFTNWLLYSGTAVAPHQRTCMCEMCEACCTQVAICSPFPGPLPTRSGLERKHNVLSCTADTLPVNFQPCTPYAHDTHSYASTRIDSIL